MTYARIKTRLVQVPGPAAVRDKTMMPAAVLEFGLVGWVADGDSAVIVHHTESLAERVRAARGTTAYEIVRTADAR